MKQGKKTIHRPNIAIVNAYTIIAVIYCVSFSIVFYSAVKNTFLAFVHLLALISVLVNYFILKKTGNFQRATNVILTTGTCAVISLFATGGWENTGFLWPFAYLPFAFFLTDKKQTIYWVLALFAGCLIIATLHFFKIITLPYSTIALFNYFAALLIFIVCMYFFQKATIDYEEFLSYTDSLLEASMDPFFTIGSDGKIVDANMIAEKIIGIGRERLIGSRFSGYFTDPEKAEEISQQVFSGAYAYNVPLGIRHFTGYVEDVLLNATLYRDEKARVHRIFATARSIAEQKRIENDLRQSEEQIQTIFNAAPDPVIVIDEEGKIVKWNPKAEALFGWTEQEVLGKSLNDTIIPSRYHEAHKKGLTHFLETGEGPILGKSIELIALNKNQTEFDVALSISPTRINNKYFFIGFIRDIREQKKAEEKFRGLLEAAPDAMVIANEKGQIVLVNRQTELLFGYERSELINQPVEILIPVNFYERHLKHRANYFKEPKVRSMGTGLELFAVRKNGTQFPVEISLSPLITEEGTLISASVRDITDRKKAEEKFKGLLEAAPDAMIIANENGQIVLVNRQTELLFDYERHELINQPIEILIPLDFRKRHVTHRANYFDEPKVRAMGTGFELFAVRKNGTQFPVEISLSPLTTEEGTLVSASVRDITDRKKAEEKKATLLNELEKVNRELETFNYSVSHDLKSPLRTITNFLQIFLKKYSNKQEEDANYLLDIINRKTQKMGELIDDLLNFSRLGKKDLDIYFINMNQLIAHVIEEQKHLNTHSSEIKYDKLDNCYGDNVLLQQVWDNLISNAIKYSRARKKQYIEIGSSRKDDEIIYWIKDNGVGFDMQYASKLFEVFQRLHDKSEFEGTGIGLALAKRIIEKHGGRIWAEGKMDEGSVFYFSIPANGVIPGKNDY